MPRDPLTLALIGLVLLIQILGKVMDGRKKNGHLTEDKVRLIVSEEMRETRHTLRNDMQAMAAAFKEYVESRFR